MLLPSGGTIALPADVVSSRPGYLGRVVCDFAVLWVNGLLLEEYLSAMLQAGELAKENLFIKLRIVVIH